MKKLPTLSKKWGFYWEILERSENYALMRQYKEKSFDTFNVIKIMRNNEVRIKDNIIPAQERIPSDSQWGTYAWNFGKDLEGAKKRFEELSHA